VLSHVVIEGKVLVILQEAPAIVVGQASIFTNSPIRNLRRAELGARSSTIAFTESLHNVLPLHFMRPVVRREITNLGTRPPVAYVAVTLMPGRPVNVSEFGAIFSSQLIFGLARARSTRDEESGDVRTTKLQMSWLAGSA